MLTRFLFVLIAIGLSGCGSQLVGPTGHRRPAQRLPAQRRPALPSTVVPQDFNQLDNVPAASIIRPGPALNSTYHEVQQGETATAIARQYGISVDSLLNENGLNRSTVLQPKQMLFIPRDAKSK